MIREPHIARERRRGAGPDQVSTPIEPATGASASAWEAGGSGLKPQALAWDEP